jgi:hypothetical protein
MKVDGIGFAIAKALLDFMWRDRKMSWMVGEGSMQTRQSAILMLTPCRDPESQGGPLS